VTAHAGPVPTMPSLNLDDHRKRLLSLKVDLLAEGDEPIEPAGNDAGTGKPDEDAQPLAEMNQVIASSRNRARADILARVVAALARLEKDPDSFGQCVECGDEIAARRLALMPYAELCVECQGARDRPQAPAGRRHLRDFK
jgi:DnaK suppressor protein